MFLYTFVNKETGDFIRYDKVETGCSEFGTQYYFIQNELYPIWFVDNEDSINFLLSNDFIHPLFSQIYKTPDFGKISLKDYEIKKIEV